MFGGALGAGARYAVGTFAGSKSGGFPWATFGVNVAGAFLLGLLMGALASNDAAEPWRLLLGVGVLGGFTTFSALAYETLTLASDGAMSLGILNMVGTGVAGLLAAALGLVVGRALA
ncbi:MAG: CrcB family protein [Actinomycetota bacterium]|nr:CrcB family protein [Actinomycetota bacterium]